jgi:phosphate starvation-inducible PhoH-like protein
MSKKSKKKKELENQINGYGESNNQIVVKKEDNPQNNNDNNHDVQKTKTKKDTSIYVPQRDKINFNLNIYEREDLTEKQKLLIDLILDKETKIVFISGPAGTSKTFCAVMAGLKLLNKRAVSDIVYVRTVVESSSVSIGALPGEIGTKLSPYLAPLYEKVEELIPRCEADKLKKDDRLQGIPVNFLRGKSANSQFWLLDEAQNANMKELITTLTRIGRHSKLIILGDPNQSDIYRQDFMKLYDLFNDEQSREQGIFCLSFNKDDIVRSGVVKYIVERVENGMIYER